MSLRGDAAAADIAVPAVRLDDVLQSAPAALLKIDVEGMELDALKGATQILNASRPVLYVENDRQAGSAELISLLQQYRYRLYWHLPALYSSNNFRGDPENIFGDKVSVNMIGIPAEIPQSGMNGFREVTGPTDHVIGS